MPVPRGNAGRGQADDALGRGQQVGGFGGVGGVVGQMPALQQHVGHTQRLQRGQAGAHAGFIGGLRDAQQPGGFLQVGRQQAHLWQQHRADPLQVAFIHQALVCAGRHHGVKYHEGRAMAGQHLGNRLGNLGVGHHADLHGGHRHVLEHGFQLRLHQLRRQRRDHVHGLRVLRHHGRHHRHAIGAQRPECLQVGLDAGPTGRISPGDGQHVGGGSGRGAGRGCRGGGHGGMSGRRKGTVPLSMSVRRVGLRPSRIPTG